MDQIFDNVFIESVVSCVPREVVHNSNFSKILDPKELKLFEKTVGIFERRWADDSTTACDLGFAAASKLLKEHKYSKGKIKALIFLSQTPDYKIPFTSNILQSRLSLNSDILCLDVNAGCAGFIQGLSLGFSILKTLKQDEKVLLIIGETLSKILSTSDRTTSLLFGDAASAIVLGHSDQTNKSHFNFFSDGNNFDSIIIEDGGCRNPYNINSLDKIEDEKKNIRSRVNLKMDGSKVFDFTLREIAPSISLLLEKSSIDIESLDFFLFHQSNKFIIRQIATKLGLLPEKTLLNIDKFGNTSGVSIPLLICSFYNNFHSTKNVLFSGYGSGLNWGNCVTDLSHTKILPILEY